MTARNTATRLTLLLAAALALALSACESSQVERGRAQARPVITRDLPSVLRNLIGAETSLIGQDPILISGYGLVVDLNGTGSGDVPLAVRAMMTQEMSRYGIGSSRAQAGAFRSTSADELIDDPNTAVVLVRGIIEPGAPNGTTFDVRIDALPGTSTTSLEGGRLYTTRLYRGQVRPGMPETETLATARGDIFSNPFADPTAPSGSAGAQSVGRILGGGVVTRAQPLRLILDNPSHSRARAITAAVNARFPREPGAPFTADGRSDEIIDINVPPSYRNNPSDFVNLLLRTRIDQSIPDEWALRYTRALKEDTSLAGELSWALRALGKVSIPHLRPLYNFPDAAPRLAALEAGAFLEDPTTRPHLEDLIENGPPAIRATALGLLASLPADPNVNRFLRQQLNNPDIDLRIAAYEGLAERADPIVQRGKVDDKFFLDIVPSTQPTVYVSQLGEPRIVLFGATDPIEMPAFATIWGDSLMIDGRPGDRRLRVFYKDDRSPRSITEAVAPDLPSIIRMLAHEPSPESPAAGLDFTYSRTVGAIQRMLDQNLADATFVAETDRLALQLARSVQAEFANERPELTATAEPDPAQQLWDDLEKADAATDEEAQTPSLLNTRQPRRFIVPVAPPPAKK